MIYCFSKNIKNGLYPDYNNINIYNLYFYNHISEKVNFLKCIVQLYFEYKYNI